MGMGPAATAARGLESLAVLCRILATLLLALMSVLIFTQVVGRNVFNVGMPWADELARFCGIGLVYLTIPLLAFRGQHVAVDMLPQLLPPQGRRALLIIAELMVLAFAAIIVVALHSFLSRAGKFATPAIGIPNYFFYAPAVIGCVLLVLAAVSRVLTLLTGPLSGPEESHQP
ncbi:TRAP transporter small permease [Aquamicrobium sp. LC103]|uniref:TRAP transporter small permease n=1 Tax=Aquamicrobium sp. LC103 TaxID=1120658 RepID=UPI00069B31E2|nr:TRAP transporter small permease [Aquamicrobium sp. LC103]TKT76166.1 TRAP transporter small permease [Aquamicrobium sp. LC103]